MLFGELISEEQAVQARQRGLGMTADFFYCRGQVYTSHHANALMMADSVYRTGWTAAHYKRDQTFIRWLQYVNETGQPY